MAPAKISRKELLKKPDEFLTFSAKTIIFAKDHSRELQYLGIGLLVLAILGLGINTYLNHIDKAGQSAYNMAYYALHKNADLENNRDNSEDIERLFNRVIDEYRISKAARLALPQLAYVNFLQGRYEEAIDHYRKFLEEMPNDPYQSLARMALAVCYEEKGEFEKAIETLALLVSGRDDFFKQQAMLSMARIYRIMGKEEASDKILKDFTERFESSPFLPLAEAYLKE